VKKSRTSACESQSIEGLPESETKAGEAGAHVKGVRVELDLTEEHRLNFEQSYSGAILTPKNRYNRNNGQHTRYNGT
jgi:hypothetical protein